MAQIIDGLCDFDNVTADMIARHNMSMYGTGDYVLQIDECLEYDLISNNEIHVKDGMYIMQGRRGCVKKGTTDICIIENGAQAVNRNDIIVIEYVKDEATRLESHTTKVIKGVPAEVAVDPELITGDINAGAVLHQMPLYRVKIEGLSIAAIEQMFEIGSVAAETVNPMEATEEGFAADAYQTKLQFDEQNKNLIAEDGTPFRFGVDENGNYGYIVTDEEGADSVIPFSRLGEWSARKSSKVGSSITIGENKHTLFTICTASEVYVCIYDLKNMKVVYKNNTSGVIAESYIDGVVKTKWSDNDTDTSTFYYMYL